MEWSSYLAIAERLVQQSTNVARDFYNIDHDTEPVDFFEREFGRIEDATAKIFQKIVVDQTWPLNHDDRTIIATFIALQNLRGPSQRNHLGQLSTALNRLHIAADGRDNGTAPALVDI